MRQVRKGEAEKTGKRDPYTFVAYVTGPVYKFDVSARDFDEAYGMAMGMLKEQIKKYDGKVKIERIDLSIFEGDIF